MKAQIHWYLADFGPTNVIREVDRLKFARFGRKEEESEEKEASVIGEIEYFARYHRKKTCFWMYLKYVGNRSFEVF